MKKIATFLCKHILFTIILIGIIGFILIKWTLPILLRFSNIGITITASLSFMIGIIFVVIAIIILTFYIVESL